MWRVTISRKLQQTHISMFSYRTLEERAQRLFSTKGKGSLDPSLMTKNKSGKASKEKELLRQRELACLEAQIYR
jgi:splicing factor 3A subunit 3